MNKKTGFWRHVKSGGGPGKELSQDREWSDVRDEYFQGVKRLRELQPVKDDSGSSEEGIVEEEKEYAETDTTSRVLSVPLTGKNWHFKSESPNSLESLLNTAHVQFACNFVKNKWQRKPLPLHNKPWNDSKIIVQSKPTSQRQVRRLKPLKHKVKRAQPLSSKEEPTEDPLHQSMQVKRLELEHRVAISPPTSNNATFSKTVVHVDLQVAKCVSLREEILRQLKLTLSRKPFQWRTDFIRLLTELCSQNFQVMESIKRWQRYRLGELNSNRTKEQQQQRQVKKEVGFIWEGKNYLEKMYSDQNFAQQDWCILRQERSEPADETQDIWQCHNVAHNPFLLQWTLPELEERIAESASIQDPEKDIWRLLENPTPQLVTRYQHAWMLICEHRIVQARQEEEQKQQDELNSRWEDIRNRLHEPKQFFREVLHTVSKEEAQIKGCWKNKTLFESNDHHRNIQLENLFTIRKAQSRFKEEFAKLRHHHDKNHPMIRNHAAERIQLVWRGHFAKVQVNTRRREQKACVRIQAALRRFFCRNLVAEKKLAQQDARFMRPILNWVDVSENAATKIQCMCRRLQAKWYVQSVREGKAATRIERWFRMISTRHKYFLFLTARVVQKVVRMRFAKNMAKILRMEKKQRRAAMQIQILFRRVRAERIAHDEMLNTAAVKIQSKARVVLAKHNLWRISCARKVQTKIRQFLARRAVTRRREAVRAVKTVQRWHRFRTKDSQDDVSHKLVAWRQQHQSRVLKFLPYWDGTGSDFHLCSLYDLRALLLKWLEELNRAESAKQALKEVNAQLAKQRKLSSKDSSRRHRVAHCTLLKVKARYEFIIRNTRYFSKQTLAEELAYAHMQLDQVTTHIGHVERLAVELIRAQNRLEKLSRVVDVQSYMHYSAGLTQFDLFEREYSRAKHREIVLKKTKRQVAELKRQVSVALRGAQWQHLGPLQAMRKTREGVKARTIQAEAREAGKHAGRFIRKTIVARVAWRRVHREKHEKQARELAERREGMSEEDQYATEMRPYLAVSSKALDKARDRFRKYDKRGKGEITPQELQHLAYDFGVAVPLNKIKQFVNKVDLNGNGTVDFVEFCIWFFIQSEKDRARFRVEKLDVHSAGQVLEASSLHVKLKTYQLTRKAQGIFLAKLQATRNRDDKQE